MSLFIVDLQPPNDLQHGQQLTFFGQNFITCAVWCIFGNDEGRERWAGIRWKLAWLTMQCLCAVIPPRLRCHFWKMSAQAKDVKRVKTRDMSGTHPRTSQYNPTSEMDMLTSTWTSNQRHLMKNIQRYMDQISFKMFCFKYSPYCVWLKHLPLGLSRFEQLQLKGVNLSPRRIHCTKWI